MNKKKNLNKITTLFLISIVVFGFLTDKSYASMDELTFKNMNMKQLISQPIAEMIFQDNKGYILIESDLETNKINTNTKVIFRVLGIHLLVIILFILQHKYKVKKLDSLINERTKDLKEEIRKNEILHKKNLKLERNKNSYFINLSHELRTPLNVISSTNQLIHSLTNKDSTISKEKLNYYIDISQRNCKILLNLINNILDNSKLQDNKYEINLKEIDIVYLVEETALTLADYISSKGINFIIDPEIEEKQIKCDAYEIERCIINLMSNAIKFTPEGGTITINIKDLDNKVEINVIDNGVGIDEKFHESIFDRFCQVSEEDVIKGGSGLGLTITKKIIEMHKGKVYVESKLGQGSKFVIILPVGTDNKNNK